MILRAAAILTAFTFCVSISGCTTKTLEANERIVTFTTKKQKIDGVVEEFKVVCPEASPDALTLLAASVSGETQAGVNIAAAYSENGANIGLRTHTIQILRDQLYSICQGYANNGITSFGYQSLLARNQRNTVLMMAIEQLTGVLKTPDVTLTTTADADASSLTRKTEELSELKGKYAALADKNTDDAKAMSQNISALEADLKNQRTSLARASGTSTVRQSANSAPDPAAIKEVVSAVKELALAVANGAAKENNLMVCMQHLQTSDLRMGGDDKAKVMDKTCGDLLIAMAQEAKEVAEARTLIAKEIKKPGGQLESRSATLQKLESTQ